MSAVEWTRQYFLKVCDKEAQQHQELKVLKRLK